MITRRRIPILDGIRGLAVMLMIGFHGTTCVDFPSGWADVWEEVSPGRIGVRILFVLSGFLITFLLAKEEAAHGRIAYRDFLVRRTLRIVPTYCAFLAVLGTWQGMGGLHMPASSWIASLTFTKNFWGFHWADGHLWSMATLLQFYLVWPLVFARLGAAGRVGMALGMIALAPLFRVASYILVQRMRVGVLQETSFFCQMDAMMFGALAAMVWWLLPQRTASMLKWHPSWMRMLAIIMIHGMALLQTHLLAGVLTVPFTGTVQSAAVAYLILSLSLVPQGALYHVLNWRWIRGAGIICFGLYIWQQPLLFWQDSEAPVVARFPWVFGTIVVVGLVSWALLERPFLKVRRRMREERSPTSATSATPVLQMAQPRDDRA